MPVIRIHWDDLPPAARDAVEQQAGPVLRAETASAGVNSGIAATVHTADASLFLKGVPADHPQVRTQQREAEINGHLPRASPRLLWHVQAAGWDLIGYERIIGRHADYSPGSPDLPHVVQALAELQQTPCPDVPLKRAEQRWGGVDQLAGDTLLHTDLAPHNVLISNRAHLIDWAWPTRGAAWIDPAVLVLRLMEAGHTAAAADSLAHQLPSWAKAPYEGVAAFSAANTQVWEEIARNDPQAWKLDMARLAREWADYWAASA